MAYRFQFRRDTESNWENIVLAEGEIGLLLDKNKKPTNLYKIGDGVTPYKDLPLFGFDGTLSNTLTIATGEDVQKTVLNKGIVVNKFNNIDGVIQQIYEIIGDDSILTDTDLVTQISNIWNTIGTQGSNENIYAEIDSIKNDIGTRGEDSNIYNSLSQIKSTIGSQGENNSVYTEINTLKNQLSDRYKTIIKSDFDFDVLKPEDLEDGAIYFVYESAQLN